MHAEAEKLGASILPGKGGLLHVQQLFLAAIWQSAGAHEAVRNTLLKAIQAAKEIGILLDPGS